MKSQNNKAITAAVGAVLLVMIAGCDDARTGSTPATKPAVASATTPTTDASAALVSYPVRPPSTFTLDGRDVMFPAAKLAVLDHRTGGITLRLCSDDPPAAIDPGYIGNSFVLDMRLAIDRVSDIPASAWDYNSSNADDSTSGIFLHGYREQYRPAEVHVTFQKDGNELLTCVNGTFLHSDSQNPAAPPQRVLVIGCLRTPMSAN